MGDDVLPISEGMSFLRSLLPWIAALAGVAGTLALAPDPQPAPGSSPTPAASSVVVALTQDTPQARAFSSSLAQASEVMGAGALRDPAHAAANSEEWAALSQEERAHRVAENAKIQEVSGDAGWALTQLVREQGVVEQPQAVSRRELSETLVHSEQLKTAITWKVERDESGVVRGMKVEAVQPGSPFEALGVQPGDLLCGNEQSDFTSGQEAANFEDLQKSAQSDAVRLCIERNGQRFVLKTDLK